MGRLGSRGYSKDLIRAAFRPDELAAHRMVCRGHSNVGKLRKESIYINIGQSRELAVLVITEEENYM